MLTENYALKLLRVAAASGILMLCAFTYGETSAPVAETGDSIPAVDAELVKKPSYQKKTYYKYQWQEVTVGSQGKFYMVCPQGVFKFVRCYPDGYQMSSDPFTFLEEDLAKSAGSPVEILSATETSTNDLDVLYTVLDKSHKAYVPPTISDQTIITRIGGEDGVGRSAKEIRAKHRVEETASQTPKEPEPKKPADPLIGHKVYYKWQWQLASVDNAEEYYMVCPNGVFKGMFCYPDNSPHKHVDFTFLEEHLISIAQHPVEILSTTVTRIGDLDVTYKIKAEGHYEKPVFSRSSIFYPVKGEDGTGKSAQAAEREHNKATGKASDSDSGGSNTAMSIFVIIGLMAFGVYWVFHGGDLLSTSSSSSSDSYTSNQTNTNRRRETQQPIEVQPMPEIERPKTNIELATEEVEAVKRKVYID